MKIPQILDLNQLCSNPSEFIINPNPGIQKLILNDYEKVDYEIYHLRKKN